MIRFEDLKGKTLTAIEVREDDDEILFAAADGSLSKLWHIQGCCESVYIEDIVGDLVDLIGEPLLLAEEVDGETGEVGGGTYTWTFYKLATINGSVTIRWYGISNGYYSESVTFSVVKEGNLE